MTGRLISAQTAVLLATVGLVLATGPAICQTVGKAAAVNPAATSSSGRTLSLGSEIIHKERVRTSPAGSLQLLFIDRTTLNIGPDSDVLIDEYVFDPQTNSGKMSVSLGKGLMRFVGGQISHQGNAQVKTPTATIGIRGAVGTFSYDPKTKVTTVTNECRACVMTMFSPTGTIQIPSGQTATAAGGSVNLARTTKQDADKNLKGTQSKSGQSGGAAKNTTSAAAKFSSRPVAVNTPRPAGGFANHSTVNEIDRTRQTTSGNTGAKVSSPPPPPSPPPPCQPSARGGCF